MVALPAFKFIFLGIRQLTRPLAKQIVARATSKHGITYSLCIGLGRVSLGMSGVIAEWSRKEELKRLENKKKTEEAERQKAAETARKAAERVVAPAGNDEAPAQTAAAAAAAAASAEVAAAPISEETKRIMKEALAYADRSRAPDGDTSFSSSSTAAASTNAATETKAAASTTTTTTTSTTPASSDAGTTAGATATAAAAAAPEKEHVVSFPNIVTPRSRSLLEPIMFGPNPQKEEPYDNSVFVDPAKRTPGAVMRVFITHPYQSAWYVFKTAFLAPFPEKRLVDAGADFMIELIAYTVLATLLFIELRQASRSAAAKEERVNARLDAIEEKINELVRTSHGAASSNVEQLPPVPELKIKGRLDSLNYLAKASYRLAENLVIDPLVGLAGGTTSTVDAGPKKTPRVGTPLTEAERAAAAATGVTVVPVYDASSRIPKAPPPDPRAKKSKHDESNAMKAELERALAPEPKASQ